MDYYDYKARQLDAATVKAVAISGTSVSAPEDHPFRRGGFIPLNPCALRHRAVPVRRLRSRKHDHVDP